MIDTGTYIPALCLIDEFISLAVVVFSNHGQFFHFLVTQAGSTLADTAALKRLIGCQPSRPVTELNTTDICKEKLTKYQFKCIYFFRPPS